MDLEDRLRRVEAAEEIRCLKARYCDLCDDGYDADALTALFADDAVWDGGELGCFEGRRRIHRFFQNMPNVMSFALHHVTNSAVNVDGTGRQATARWYLLQTATLRENNSAVWLMARYEDELVYVGDAWKFQRVTLRSRVFSPYEDGWARTPMLRTDTG
jgi:hypothetical protein